ncbi:NUDIX hydrolase [candidate division KSB1 bacterium]|nr:NUDIX hydrolase [candidate division KSB1 bacterium]
MSEPLLLKWARELMAIAQSGMHYTDNVYDKERFIRVRQLAAEMIANNSALDLNHVLKIMESEGGYATPKVDVRGVVFREDKILLVREIMDQNRWTLPGGWADVNESPAESVEREVYEESGFRTKVDKVLAVYDRTKQGHVPAYIFHIYKLFFHCTITGGEAAASMETSEVGFFSEKEIPELSVARVTDKQIRRFFEHHRHPDLPTDFD